MKGKLIGKERRFIYRDTESKIKSIVLDEDDVELAKLFLQKEKDQLVVVKLFYGKRLCRAPCNKDSRNSNTSWGLNKHCQRRKMIKLKTVRLGSANVRLIGEDGEQLGIMSTANAARAAEVAGLDLVEVSAGDPPVCKIMDWGRFKYSKTKKTEKAKTRQQKMKELRVRPKTAEHDINTKVTQARKFLLNNDKVVFSVLFKGRELARMDDGQQIIATIIEKLSDVAKVEKPPAMEGRRLAAILTPKKS